MDLYETTSEDTPLIRGRRKKRRLRDFFLGDTEQAEKASKDYRCRYARRSMKAKARAGANTPAAAPQGDNGVDSEPWFLGGKTRAEASSLLEGQLVDEGEFFVYENEEDYDALVLCVWKNSSARHLLLSFSPAAGWRFASEKKLKVSQPQGAPPTLVTTNPFFLSSEGAHDRIHKSLGDFIEFLLTDADAPISLKYRETLRGLRLAERRKERSEQRKQKGIQSQLESLPDFSPYFIRFGAV